MEVVSYDLIARNVAKQQWLIPNPEWFVACDHRPGLLQFDKILCKTHDAVRIFKELADRKQTVQYIGFESRDLYDPEIPRERKFLHVAGQSQYKNTKSTVYAFSKICVEDGALPELTVVSAYPDEFAFGKDCPNIKAFTRVTDEELKQMMNSHIFHIMPSGYEGWGHSLNEGLGCGAVVLTTDFPPMRDFDGICKDLLVAYQDTIPELSAQRARVVAGPVWAAVKKAMAMKNEDLVPIQAYAREAFLKQREDFRANLKRIVEE